MQLPAPRVPGTPWFKPICRPSAGVSRSRSHRCARSRSAVLGCARGRRIPLDDVFAYINEVALIRGQWQVRKGKLTEEQYRRLLKEKILPELTRLKEQAAAEQLLQPKVVYGYFPCQSAGNDLIIYDEDHETERMRFTFPRQSGDRHLCLADYFASVESGRMDVVAFQLVTMGKRASEHSASSSRRTTTRSISTSTD